MIPTESTIPWPVREALTSSLHNIYADCFFFFNDTATTEIYTLSLHDALPIRDLAGDVIAFGARKLSADDQGPKYLNTPETMLFKKSSVLYGADLAKRDIAKRRQAVIVEGYTDVMACH